MGMGQFGNNDRCKQELELIVSNESKEEVALSTIISFELQGVRMMGPYETY